MNSDHTVSKERNELFLGRCSPQGWLAEQLTGDSVDKGIGIVESTVTFPCDWDPPFLSTFQIRWLPSTAVQQALAPGSSGNHKGPTQDIVGRLARRTQRKTEKGRSFPRIQNGTADGFLCQKSMYIFFDSWYIGSNAFLKGLYQFPPFVVPRHTDTSHLLGCVDKGHCHEHTPQATCSRGSLHEAHAGL